MRKNLQECSLEKMLNVQACDEIWQILAPNPILNNLRVLLIAIMRIKIKTASSHDPEAEPAQFFVNSAGDLIISEEGFKSIASQKKYKQLRQTRIESEIRGKEKKVDIYSNLKPSVAKRIRSNDMKKKQMEMTYRLMREKSQNALPERILTDHEKEYKKGPPLSRIWNENQVWKRLFDS